MRGILREYLAVDVVEPARPVTIHDLALDGTFPSDRYEERLRLWARSILDKRRGGSHV